MDSYSRHASYHEMSKTIHFTFSTKPKEKVYLHKNQKSEKCIGNAKVFIPFRLPSFEIKKSNKIQRKKNKNVEICGKTNFIIYLRDNLCVFRPKNKFHSAIACPAF